MKKEPPVYEKFINKDKCLRPIGKLENGLIYLNMYFQYNLINVSNIFIIYKLQNKHVLNTCTFTTHEVVGHFVIHRL